MRLLSFNVSWESMLARNSMLDPDRSEKCSVGGVNICKQNIISVFTSNPSDFFCIQEASGFDAINFPSMKKINHRSEFEDSFIYYNEKYTIGEIYKGDFERGRPYIIAEFIKDSIKTVVINVHLSETASRGLLEAVGKTELEYKSEEIQKLENRLQPSLKATLKNLSTRVIIAGDFNCNFIDAFKIKIFDRQFSMESRPINTCCDFKITGNAKYYNQRYDHILITDNLNLTSYNTALLPTPLFSDHLPMIYEINDKIQLVAEKKYLKYKTKYLVLKNQIRYYI